MFSNKMMVALVGAGMILTSSAFAKDVKSNSKAKLHKGKPGVVLAQGANAKAEQLGGGLKEANPIQMRAPENTIVPMPASSMMPPNLFQNRPAAYQTANQSGSGQPGRGLWMASIAALAGANVADARSSWGKGETNRTLAGAQGDFGARGTLIKSGVNSVWVVGQLVALRKNPAHRRLLAIVNFAAASVFAVTSYHNYGIAGPGARR
jgi:hypothetical protein